MSVLSNEIIEINEAKDKHDLFALRELIDKYKETSAIEEVKSVFYLLKNEEIERVKKEPCNYDPHYLLYLIEEGIFTKQELIDSGVLTESVYKRLLNYDPYAGSFDFRGYNDDCELKCAEGSTDVYFWGVNGVGKSNLLMGLINTNGCCANLINEYAFFLRERHREGVIPRATPYGFASSIHTRFEKNGEKHKVNLIDYDGYTLVKDIVCNDKHIFKLADIDTKVTRALQNSNRKVFFILIDPLLEIPRLGTEVKDEATGVPTMSYFVISQRTIIHKLCHLFCYRENADILKNVDAIHFIVTKADCLGKTHAERVDEATKLLSSKYRDVLEEFSDLCKYYGINGLTNFQPQIYTFSLGKLYVGGLFDFDPTDANTIADVIVGNCPTRHKSIKEKILRLFRK